MEDDTVKTGKWTWQRMASGVFAVAGAFCWLMGILGVILSKQTVPLNTTLVLLISLPLGIFYFGHYAIKGYLPMVLGNK